MHFVRGNSNVTSSEAVLPILPNIAFEEREKDFCMIYGTPELSTLCNVCTKITYFIRPIRPISFCFEAKSRAI